MATSGLHFILEEKNIKITYIYSHGRAGSI